MSRRFSERVGKRALKTVIQIDSMDEELRNSLWNIMDCYIYRPLLKETLPLPYAKYRGVFDQIWRDFFKEPMDQINTNKLSLVEEMRIRFFRWSYLEVYD